MPMNFHRKLPIPQEVKKEYPLTERMEQVKAARDAFFAQDTYILRGCESAYAFDGNPDTFFDGNEENEHKPSNFIENCFAYTGTHDNQTLKGFKALGAEVIEKDNKFIINNEIECDYVIVSIGAQNFRTFLRDLVKPEVTIILNILSFSDCKPFFKPQNLFSFNKSCNKTKGNVNRLSDYYFNPKGIIYKVK